MREEVKKLLRDHALKKFDQPVKLSSGSWTREYIDGKQITLFPERIHLVSRIIVEEVDLGGIHAVGGLSMGADPIATAVSLVAYLEKGLKIPVFLVRSKVKEHGLEKAIEGVALEKGMKVMIVEDVITQGSAVLTAIKAVEARGIEVGQVVCLVDREAGGSEIIRKKYPFHALFKISDLR